MMFNTQPNPAPLPRRGSRLPKGLPQQTEPTWPLERLPLPNEKTRS